MSVTNVAHRLVDLCKDNLDQQAVDELYSNDIVSVECGEQVMRTEGMPGLQEKMQWWYDNHEVHNIEVEGPYLSAGNQFAVKFTLDCTPKDGERNVASEIAVYTVGNGKVIHEEFWYGA